jgi:hypothetical protein
MEIDFHLAVTYSLARIAKFTHDDAVVIATSSQYVDDTVNSGPVTFKTGEAFWRLNTSHEFKDYKILSSIEERRIWVPFHFLPGNNPVGPDSNPYFNRLITRPNSAVAQAMCTNCILKKSRPFALHQLGITAHVFVDTWAHQGFAGVRNQVNHAKDIELIPGETMGFNRQLWEIFRTEGIREWFNAFIIIAKASFLNFGFPMGHGMVLHYPDHPFRK